MEFPALLDMTHDPVVVINVPALGTEGRIRQFHSALEWLIARGKYFVLVTQASDDEAEPVDERKERVLWFKDGAPRLAAVCRGFVYVEPNDEKRAMWEERAKAMASVFPVPMVIAHDFQRAISAARDLAESAIL